ncbi:MAG: hypothetical protein U0610_24940 [bacterium]
MEVGASRFLVGESLSDLEGSFEEPFGLGAVSECDVKVPEPVEGDREVSLEVGASRFLVGESLSDLEGSFEEPFGLGAVSECDVKVPELVE